MNGPTPCLLRASHVWDSLQIYLSPIASTVRLSKENCSSYIQISHSWFTPFYRGIVPRLGSFLYVIFWAEGYNCVQLIESRLFITKKWPYLLFWFYNLVVLQQHETLQAGHICPCVSINRHTSHTKLAYSTSGSSWKFNLIIDTQRCIITSTFIFIACNWWFI